MFEFYIKKNNLDDQSDKTEQVRIVEEAFHYKDCEFCVSIGEGGLRYGCIDLPKNSIFYNLHHMYVNKMKFMENIIPKCTFCDSFVSERYQSYFFHFESNQNYIRETLKLKNNIELTESRVRNEPYGPADYIEACKKLIDIMTSDYIC